MQVWSLAGKIPQRRAWQPTPVFLPGKSHGQRRLVGYSPWGHRESDVTKATARTLTLYTHYLFLFCPHILYPIFCLQASPVCLHPKSLSLLIHFLLLDPFQSALWSRPKKEIWNNLETGQCGVHFRYHTCIFAKIFLEIEYQWFVE